MCRLTLFLAALLCLPAAQAQGLGKLFFTPAERAALDRERQRSGMPESTKAPGELAMSPDNLTVDGYVRRSGGRSTVWINGQPQYGRDAAPPVRVTEKGGHAGQVWVQPADSARSVPLKVGQVLTPASGEVRERWQLEQPAPAPAAPTPPTSASPQGETRNQPP
jgi:hypothetical protein